MSRPQPLHHPREPHRPAATSSTHAAGLAPPRSGLTFVDNFLGPKIRAADGTTPALQAELRRLLDEQSRYHHSTIEPSRELVYAEYTESIARLELLLAERGNSSLPDAAVQLFFDGHSLTMAGATQASWPAVSGRPGEAGAFDSSSRRQRVENVGPIPAGVYWIDPRELKDLQVRWFYSLRFKQAWGSHRITIHPFDTTHTFGRGGFFIHGGVVPGGAGCIDLTSAMPDFARTLGATPPGVKVKLTVAYPTVTGAPRLQRTSAELIPAAANSTDAAPPTSLFQTDLVGGTIETVGPGDSPASIAARVYRLKDQAYSDLIIQANKLPPKPILQVGQKLFVPQVRRGVPTAPPAAKAVADKDAYQVPVGQATFDAEGKTSGALTLRPHYPRGASGVTIGRGYDMKDREPKQVKSELKAAGVSEAIATALSEGAGANDPGKFETEHSTLTITPTQQWNLFVQEFRRQANKALANIVQWELSQPDEQRIDPAALDATATSLLMDLQFRGDLGVKRWRGALRTIITDRVALVQYVQDRSHWHGVPEDRYRYRCAIVGATPQPEPKQQPKPKQPAAQTLQPHSDSSASRDPGVAPAGAAPAVVHEALAGPSQALEPAVQRDMQVRLGHDFGPTRVHLGTLADASARAVGALAYTVGNHVAFRDGAYQPGTPAGTQLIAHELVHVIQQSRSPFEPSRPIALGDPTSAAEAEADRVAASALAGTPRAGSPTLPAASVLQRTPDPASVTDAGPRPARPSSPATQMAALLAAARNTDVPAGKCYAAVKRAIKAARGYGDILDIYCDPRFPVQDSAIDFHTTVKSDPASFGLETVPGSPVDAPAGSILITLGNGKVKLSEAHGDIAVIDGLQTAQRGGALLIAYNDGRIQFPGRASDWSSDRWAGVLQAIYRPIARALDRADAPTNAVVAAPQEPPTLKLAQTWLEETPTSADARAAWLLKLASAGFVAFNTAQRRQQLEDIRDKKKVENRDPAAADYDVPVLAVIVGLVRQRVHRWIDSGGPDGLPCIELGAMIRNEPGRAHDKGQAIDIDRLKTDVSVDAALTILRDLDKTVHVSYGLGMPYQSDFFDPNDDMQDQKKAAENAAAKAATSIEVQDALVKFTAHTWRATATRSTDGKWIWSKEELQKADGAWKHLKSDALKKCIKDLRATGLQLMIFPDNPNHLHINMR